MPKSIYSEQAGRTGKQLAHIAQRVSIIWLDSTSIMETMDTGCLETWNLLINTSGAINDVSYAIISGNLALNMFHKTLYREEAKTHCIPDLHRFYLYF